MKTIEDEILLVIPYVNSGQGNELELALTGWRKYCESPLRIIVIGDYNPAIDGKAEYVNCQRVSNIPNQYNPNIDVARKLDKIYDMFHEEYDHFVLANDDEYPIRPFDWKFLTRVTYLQSAFIGNENSPANYWIHDMWKTRKELDRCKKGHINYCNHHPFYFDMEKFHDISKRFNLANNSLIRENLYYNYYDFKPKDNVNTIRFGFWDNKSPKDKFRSVLSDPKIRFMCNSVAGWSSELMELIDKRYKDDVVKKTIVTENLNLSKGDEKIIVSFTSWKKRINNCLHTVDLMRQQSLKPDKIVLNLSTDEFPQKENELPQDLVKAQDDLFEIYWVKENNKVYKKIIPTLERYPNDVVLSIDDDIEYPINYIETLFSEYVKNDKRHPIAAFKNVKELNGVCHSGPFSLVKAEFFGPYLKDLYENLVLKVGIDKIYASDDVYFYAALLNCSSYRLTNQDFRIKMKNLYSDSRKTNNTNYSIYNTDWHKMYSNEVLLLRTYIKDKYKKEYKDLISNLSNEKYGIIALTSWKNRIEYVYKTLETLIECKHAKIVLTLSSNEFPKKEEELPESLMRFVKDGEVEILWVEKNYKSFKKLLFTMDKYRDYPIVSADDDALYPKNYFDKLYAAYLKNPNAVSYNSPGNGSGYGYIFPPYIFRENTLKFIDILYKQYDNDDLLYITLCKKMGIKMICLNNKKGITFHSKDIAPINLQNRYKNTNYRIKEKEYYIQNIKI